MCVSVGHDVNKGFTWTTVKWYQIDNNRWINITQNELLNFICTDWIYYFILSESFTFYYEMIKCKKANLFIIAMLG